MYDLKLFITIDSDNSNDNQVV